MSASKIVKVTFEMPVEELEELKQLAGQRDLTVTDTLRQAVKTEKFFRDNANRGSLILLQRPDRTYERVLLQ